MKFIKEVKPLERVFLVEMTENEAILAAVLSYRHEITHPEERLWQKLTEALPDLPPIGKASFDLADQERVR